MVHIATTITFAATLVGFAMGEDHSRHNCCVFTRDGWEVENDWTADVCYEKYAGVVSNYNFRVAAKLINEIRPTLKATYVSRSPATLSVVLTSTTNVIKRVKTWVTETSDIRVPVTVALVRCKDSHSFFYLIC